MNIQTAWDYLTENGIATEEELQLITGIMGYRIEVLNDVSEYRTGESLPEDDEECNGEHNSTDELFECEDCSALLETED